MLRSKRVIYLISSDFLFIRVLFVEFELAGGVIFGWFNVRCSEDRRLSGCSLSQSNSHHVLAGVGCARKERGNEKGEDIRSLEGRRNRVTSEMRREERSCVSSV